MNTPMITALIAVLVIAIVVLIIKMNSAKDERNVLKHEAYNLSNTVKNLRKENQTIISVSISRRDALIHAKNQLLRYEGTLVDDLIFVMTDSGKLAVNVKVKTVTGKDGKTTLNPTIRRKIDNEWKEVPVHIRYGKYSK